MFFTIEFALVDDLVQKEDAIAHQLALLALVKDGHLHVQLVLKHIEADLVGCIEHIGQKR